MTDRSDSGSKSSGTAPRHTDTLIDITSTKLTLSHSKSYPSAADTPPADGVAEPLFRADILSLRYTHEVVNSLDRPPPLQNPVLPKFSALPRLRPQADGKHQGHDPVTLYLNEIGRIPLLDAEQEVRLARAAARGHKPSRDHMIVANLRLVVSLAKRFVNRGMDLLDLVEEGNLGLIHAVEKFNPELGFRFSTYASWWIKQSMDRALTNQAGTVRLPVHIAKELNSCLGTALKLHEQLQREPRPREIAVAMQCTEQRVHELLSYRMQFCSTDTMLSETEDLALVETLVAEDDEPRAEAEQADLNRSLDHWLDRLSEKHRAIIARRFGLRGFAAATLEEVGRDVGLTRERVRQLQMEALLKLRRIVEREGLTLDCLEDK